MRRISIILACLAASFLTTGCSSTLSSIFERAVTTENMKTDTVLTMTGERRIAVAVNRPQGNNLIICAESLPDASRYVDSSSKIDAQLQQPQSGSKSPVIAIEDKFGTKLLQTFTRTTTSDVVRQLGWQACQAYASGAIDGSDYNKILLRIADGAFRVLETSAHNEKPAPLVE